MIHAFVVAMAAGATVGDLAEAIHAYPTFAEGIKVAAGKWLDARLHWQQSKARSEGQTGLQY